MCGIYLIRNTVTNKVYIGQSVDIERRWSEHKARAFNLNNNCTHKPLYLSMRKYGIDVFTVEVLCECSPEELNEKEEYYIYYYNSISPNGYNIANNCNQRVIKRDVSLKPHQIANGKIDYCNICGKVITANTKTNLCQECYKNSIKNESKPNKEDLIQELVDNNGNFSAVGRLHNVSNTTIRKWCRQYNISAYSNDYKQVKQIKQPFKIAVNQIDKNTNEVIATYESANAAARALGKEKGNHITEVCKGIHTTAYGYKWEYAALM